MTDLEKLKELLDSWGVQYGEEEHNDCKVITCSEGDNKVAGYDGFVTVFKFELDGIFKYMGAWE